MRKNDIARIARGFLTGVGIGAVIMLVVYGLSVGGGINTAGGLCPDGVQDYGTRYWKTLPTSDGMVDEGVSDKWDHVQMNLFICNDGSVMGRADFRPGKKGR